VARAVEAIGPDSQRLAQRELGWDRETIRKGLRELKTGVECVDGRCANGAKSADELWPNLRADLQDILQSQTQTDPRFHTTRLYRRLSVAQLVVELKAQKGYTDRTLPSDEAIRTLVNGMGYAPSKVQKTKPKKKVPETDAIFEQMRQLVQQVDASPQDETLRISIDTKAAVKIGLFSRGGYSRLRRRALDHDFQPDAILMPVGIVVPKYGELTMFFVESKATADCLVDMVQAWWDENRERFPSTRQLLIQQDNGPENNTRRSQYMHRMVQFADENQLGVQLACFPPYHSKYNPIERCWGVLENAWNGDLLDSIPAALGHAAHMTWKGLAPVVHLVQSQYEAGVKLAKDAMRQVESRLHRDLVLGKWFVQVAPSTATS